MLQILIFGGVCASQFSSFDFSWVGAWLIDSSLESGEFAHVQFNKR